MKNAYELLSHNVNLILTMASFWGIGQIKAYLPVVENDKGKLLLLAELKNNVSATNVKLFGIELEDTLNVKIKATHHLFEEEYIHEKILEQAVDINDIEGSREKFEMFIVDEIEKQTESEKLAGQTIPILKRMRQSEIDSSKEFLDLLSTKATDEHPKSGGEFSLIRTEGMQKSLKSILAEERNSRLITNLCEKFGYANPQFIGNSIILPEANPREVIFLIVERNRNAARVGATLIPLQTILQDKLGIKVELVRKEQIKEIFYEKIMAHAISILENEEKFKEYFSNNMQEVSFDELEYEPLIRDEEFEKDLQRARRILEKSKLSFDQPILFPPNLVRKSLLTSEKLEAKQNEENRLPEEIEDFESSINEPAPKRKRLS